MPRPAAIRTVAYASERIVYRGDNYSDRVFSARFDAHLEDLREGPSSDARVDDVALQDAIAWGAARADTVLVQIAGVYGYFWAAGRRPPKSWGPTMGHEPLKVPRDAVVPRDPDQSLPV